MIKLAGYISVIYRCLTGTVRNEILRVLDGAAGNVNSPLKYPNFLHFLCIVCSRLGRKILFRVEGQNKRALVPVCRLFYQCELVVDTLFVVDIANSLVAAWLYDMIRHSGKH